MGIRLQWIAFGAALTAMVVGACDSDEPGSSGPDAGVSVADAASEEPPPPDAAPLPDAPAPEDQPELPLACELSEVTPVATCAAENCIDDLGDSTALVLCLTLNCGAEFLGLSPECSQCVLAGLSGDFETAQEKCLDDGGGSPFPLP